MQVQWYGQSAFRLTAGDTTVAIDPFADLSGLAGRGMHFDYPPIDGLAADLLLVTHEHPDHQQAGAIVARLSPRWVVPMHYRTARIGFLETADAFLECVSHVERLPGAVFDTAALPVEDTPVAVVPAAP
jgi:L-ascorbate metabolism protein UlaG (beta-lactamase superfamily)